MKRKFFISIIVPVFNGERYLQQCIKSILRQTYTEFEVILIDDGSTDNSGMICDAFRSSNVRVVHQKNMGVSVARNEGIKLAQGSYIMFVDADDTLDKNALMWLVEYAMKYDNPSVVIAELDTVTVNTDTLNNEFFDFISLNEFWSPCAKLFKKDKIRYLFDEHIYIAEDLWFCYQNKTFFSSYAFLPKTIYHYRRNDKSAMTKKVITDRDFTALDVVLWILGDHNLSDKIKSFYMAYYIKMYYFLLSKKGDNSVLRRARKKYGSHVKPFYKRVCDAGMSDIKLFIQVNFTFVYNILSRIKRR